MTSAKIVGSLSKLQDSTLNGVAIYRIYTHLCSAVPLFVYEARMLGISLNCRLKFDSQRTDDHIFRHRGDIKYSPKHIKLWGKLGFEPNNMMCYTHL